MDGKRPTVASRHGVVAAAHPLAAAAGARLLGRGGNAFDAAVAAAAALGVVEPALSGLAGFGAATCWVAGDRRIRTLTFGPAGRPNPLPAGVLATAAPGCLAGWYNLVSAHGTRTLAEALAPAIAFARDGVPLIGSAAAAINQAAAAGRGRPGFEAWNAAYTEGRGAVRAGQVLRQPDLAATLEAIAAGGTRHLYGGRLGALLVAHVQSLGGSLGLADLEAVAAAWGRPVSAAWRDLVVHAPAPPGPGFENLLALRLLDGVALGATGRDGAAALDTLWRALRLAAMQRLAQGNPMPDELDRLLGEESVARLRNRLADGQPVEGGVAPAAAPGTVLAVADRAGNAVCLTQSLGAAFGCGVVVPGTGVCLNAAAGAAMPAAPLLATRGRGPVLALAGPGAVQVLVQYEDFGLSLQDAVAAPRASLGEGRQVLAEGRLAAPVLEALRALGHAVESGAPWLEQEGGVQAVALDPATSVVTGAADPRRDGYVATN